MATRAGQEWRGGCGCVLHHSNVMPTDYAYCMPDAGKPKHGLHIEIGGLHLGMQFDVHTNSS